MLFPAFILTLLAATLTTSVVADAGLNAAVAFDNGLGSLDQGLLDNLHAPHYDLSVWAPGWIPQDCKDIVEGQNLSASDVTIWNVNYTDCSSPWVICTHKDAPLTQTVVADLFGKIPVKMRSTIRHLISVPGPGIGAFNAGDNIMFSGANDHISVFVHEVGHSVDTHGYPNISAGAFHETDIWLDNYAKDSAVADAYANCNQAENHSQELVVALFDHVVPGGVGTVNSNWTEIAHQYETIQGFVGVHGDMITPGGVCSDRHNNSEPVRLTESPDTGTGPAPDVGLKDGVKVYDFLPMQTVVNATVVREDGTVGLMEVQVLKQ
ncbi:conidiation-specific protein (con-13) protein [Diplodia corticola]|uniref:Conidiation-specific protein (Con-13) protein n=1 Tax=Diplodia corticola TaxID=236234 RepID=A0A1J9RYT3_9PEZI|nr:conidiation-specific protein (con-13) protein [Diplodia corticola]OJD32605.1 conidiation-specific protein (con-13) protein [Diplodia corticola]